MARISEAEVRETALLARLQLSDEEVARMTGELDAILGYMETLGKLDVADVPPTAHAVPMQLRLRPDEPGPHLPPDEAMGDAPRRHEDWFEVPKIIEVGE
jgi:aspartyl-tRNA(Asn)/glutamyl-tRNA(Gln) amidotransferase subunit C